MEASPPSSQEAQFSIQVDLHLLSDENEQLITATPSLHPTFFTYTYHNETDNNLEALFQQCLQALGEKAPPAATTEMFCDVENTPTPISSDHQLRRWVEEVATGCKERLIVTLGPRRPSPTRIILCPVTCVCEDGTTRQFDFKYEEKEDAFLLVALRKACLTAWEVEDDAEEDIALYYQLEDVAVRLSSDIQVKEVLAKRTNGLHLVLQRPIRIGVTVSHQGNPYMFEFTYIQSEPDLIGHLKKQCLARICHGSEVSLDTVTITEGGRALHSDSQLHQVLSNMLNLELTIACVTAAHVSHKSILCRLDAALGETQIFHFPHVANTNQLTDFKKKILNLLQLATEDVALILEGTAGTVHLTTDRVLDEVLGKSEGPFFVRVESSTEIRLYHVVCEYEGTAAEFQFKVEEGRGALTGLRNKCLWEHDISESADVQLMYQGNAVSSEEDLQRVLQAHQNVKDPLEFNLKKLVGTHLTIQLTSGKSFKFWFSKKQEEEGQLLASLQVECAEQTSIPEKELVLGYETQKGERVILSTDRVLCGVIGQHLESSPWAPLQLTAECAHKIVTATVVQCFLDDAEEPIEWKYTYTLQQDGLLDVLRNDCIREHDLDRSTELQLVWEGGQQHTSLDSDRTVREVLQQKGTDQPFVIRARRAASVHPGENAYRVIRVQSWYHANCAEFQFKYLSDALLETLKRDVFGEQNVKGDDDLQLFYEYGDEFVPLTTDSILRQVLSQYDPTKPLVIRVRREEETKTSCVAKSQDGITLGDPTPSSLKVVCTRYYGAHRDVAEFELTTQVSSYDDFCSSLLQRCAEELEVAPEFCYIVCHIGGADLPLSHPDIQQHINQLMVMNMVQWYDELHCSIHVSHSGLGSGSTFGRTVKVRYEGRVETFPLSMHPNQVSVHKLAEMVLRKLGFKGQASFLMLYEDASEVIPLTSDEQLLGVLNDGSIDIPLSLVVRKRESIWDMSSPPQVKTDNDHHRERIVDHVMFFWDVDVGEYVPYEQFHQLVSTFTVGGRYLTLEDPLLCRCAEFRATCPVEGIVLADLKTNLMEWTHYMDISTLQAFAEHAIETLHFTYDLSAHSRLRKSAWDAFTALDVTGTHTISYEQLMTRLRSFPPLRGTKLFEAYFPPPLVGTDSLALAGYRQGMWRLLIDLEEMQGHELLRHIQTQQPPSPTSTGTKQQKATRTRLDALRFARLHSEIRHAFNCVQAKHIDAFASMYVVSSVVPLMVATCTLLDIKTEETYIANMQYWYAIVNAVKEDSAQFLLSLSNFHEDNRTHRLTLSKVAKVVPMLLTRDFQPEAIIRHGWFLSALCQWCRAVCEFACVLHGWPWPCVEVALGDSELSAPPPVSVLSSAQGNPSEPNGSSTIIAMTPQRPATSRIAVPGRGSTSSGKRRPVSAQTSVATDHEDIMTELNADLGLTPPRPWELNWDHGPSQMTPKR